MSRPLRILLSGVLLASGLAFSSCVGTLYDRTYTYKRNYFKPPKEGPTVSAESILGPEKRNEILDSGAPGGLPAPGGDLPPPGAAPAPDAGIPGVPAAPPPAPPPPN